MLHQLGRPLTQTECPGETPHNRCVQECPGDRKGHDTTGSIQCAWDDEGVKNIQNAFLKSSLGANMARLYALPSLSFENGKKKLTLSNPTTTKRPSLVAILN